VLVTALVNAENVDYLVGEMISYLVSVMPCVCVCCLGNLPSLVVRQGVADDETKPDLCDRIGKAAATFAPSRKWHIDTLIRVLAIAGSADVSGIAASVLILISQTPELYGYVAHKLYSLVEDDTSQLPLVHVAVWCIGEYGELLLAPPSDAEAGKARSETEVMNLLIKITRMFNATADTKSRVLAAMLKLTTRFSTPIEQARIRFVRPLC
jgi:AP-1 complex subunit gamma-1